MPPGKRTPSDMAWADTRKEHYKSLDQQTENDFKIIKKSKDLTYTDYQDLLFVDNNNEFEDLGNDILTRVSAKGLDPNFPIPWQGPAAAPNVAIRDQIINDILQAWRGKKSLPLNYPDERAKAILSKLIVRYCHKGRKKEREKGASSQGTGSGPSASLMQPPPLSMNGAQTLSSGLPPGSQEDAAEGDEYSDQSDLQLYQPAQEKPEIRDVTIDLHFSDLMLHEDESREYITGPLVRYILRQDLSQEPISLSLTQLYSQIGAGNFDPSSDIICWACPPSYSIKRVETDENLTTAITAQYQTATSSQMAAFAHIWLMKRSELGAGTADAIADQMNRLESALSIKVYQRSKRRSRVQDTPQKVAKIDGMLSPHGTTPVDGTPVQPSSGGAISTPADKDRVMKVFVQSRPDDPGDAELSVHGGQDTATTNSNPNVTPSAAENGIASATSLTIGDVASEQEQEEHRGPIGGNEEMDEDQLPWNGLRRKPTDGLFMSQDEEDEDNDLPALRRRRDRQHSRTRSSTDEPILDDEDPDPTARRRSVFETGLSGYGTQRGGMSASLPYSGSGLVPEQRGSQWLSNLRGRSTGRQNGGLTGGLTGNLSGEQGGGLGGHRGTTTSFGSLFGRRDLRNRGQLNGSFSNHSGGPRITSLLNSESEGQNGGHSGGQNGGHSDPAESASKPSSKEPQAGPSEDATKPPPATQTAQTEGPDATGGPDGVPAATTAIEDTPEEVAPPAQPHNDDSVTESAEKKVNVEDLMNALKNSDTNTLLDTNLRTHQEHLDRRILAYLSEFLLVTMEELQDPRRVFHCPGFKEKRGLFSYQWAKIAFEYLRPNWQLISGLIDADYMSCGKSTTAVAKACLMKYLYIQFEEVQVFWKTGKGHPHLPKDCQEGDLGHNMCPSQSRYQWGCPCVPGSLARRAVPTEGIQGIICPNTTETDMFDKAAKFTEKGYLKFWTFRQDIRKRFENLLDVQDWSRPATKHIRSPLPAKFADTNRRPPHLLKEEDDDYELPPIL